MFQIYNALEVMHRFRINHNDLHPGNILVMELPEKVSLGFEVDNVFYKIRTKYIPYIFDWDLGYCELLGDNPKISGYKFIDFSNQYTPRRDLYILLCYLYNNEKYLGLRSGFVDLDLFPIVMDKEQQKSIPITPDQVNIIRSYRPVYIQNNKNPVYKLGKRQAEEIFGKNIGKQNTKNLNTITFEITKDYGQYYASLVTGFECRPTSMHAQFPTPLELLEKMDRFKVSSIKPGSVQKIYKMPRPDIAKRIYIDQDLQKLGRQKLLAQGVRPRFSPVKSGYVKVKNLDEEKSE
jgi:serine/threonine protein kinase